MVTMAEVKPELYYKYTYSNAHVQIIKGLVIYTHNYKLEKRESDNPNKP
jgi:hypothetical protein